MYLCQVCNACSEPGESLKVHTLYRYLPEQKRKIKNIDRNGDILMTLDSSPSRTEILREIPVCHECKEMLDSGIPINVLLRQRGVVKRMGTVESVEGPSNPPVTIFRPVALQAGQWPSRGRGNRPKPSPHVNR